MPDIYLPRTGTSFGARMWLIRHDCWLCRIPLVRNRHLVRVIRRAGWQP